MLCALLCGCVHAPLPRPDVSLDGIDYRFRVDAKLEMIEAQVCFRGHPPPELVSGVHWGGDYLKRAWSSGPRGTRPLAVVEHRIQLRGLAPGACAHYAIDVGAAARSYGGLDATRRGDALVSNVAFWLWRPPQWQGVRELSARFDLPAGMRASLPWPRRGDRYVLDQSALAFYAFAVFGRFDQVQAAAPGATLEVAILPGLSEATRANVVPWLEQAAREAALVFGHFPRRRVQVVVIPTSPSGEPVRFGTMNRGGGASAAMLLPANAKLQPLLHDWIAVHEFCHLLLPFVERDDAWLSEGLATYYQEVLRVRSGMESEQDAWRRLYEGSLLGRDAKQNLAEESADMFVNFSFKMVYWAGASFALMSDVELRRRTHGRLRLDDVVRELAAERHGPPHPLRARELLERMDKIAGVPVFTELMRRWVDGPSLPDLQGLYRQLGIEVSDQHVETLADAKDAWIREAIMHEAPNRALASRGLGRATRR